MKKLILYGLFLLSISGFSQSKTIYSSMIVTPKPDQALHFENSLKPHVTKFHGPDNRQVVFQIISGPNTGSYQVVEGPFSWSDMDKIPPSNAHFEDVQVNLAPKIEKNHGKVFAARIDSVSYGTAGIGVEKSRILFFTLKPGQLSTFLGLLSKLKDAVAKSGETRRNAAVYVKLLEEVAGSHPQVIIVRRFPNGWMEMEDGYIMSVKDMITKAYSADYWEEWLKATSGCVESTESFLRIYRADLSSK